MDDLIVIDDFFVKYHQKEIETFYNIGKDVCWTYVKSADCENQVKKFQENDNSVVAYDQFIRKLDNKHENYWHNIIKNNIKKHFQLDAKEIMRLRMVFSIPRILVPKDSYGTPHVDYPQPHYTLIYYVNNSLCKTIFFNELYNGKDDHSKKTIAAKVQPKQGRAVLFNGLRYHTVEAYNETNRLLLNVNFTV